MTILQILLIMLGILLGIVLLCLGVIYLERKAPGKEYDERQKLSRGRAYRVSFWSGMGYYLVIGLLLLGQVDGQKRVEPWLLVFWGVMIQIIVNHTYCLLTDSALPFAQKGTTMIFSHLVSGSAFLLSLWCFALERDGLSLLGHGSSTLAFLTIGICHFYLALLYMIQTLRNRRE